MTRSRLGPSWVSWSFFFCGVLEQFGGLVEGALGCLGPSWVHLSLSWRRIGAELGSRGAILAELAGAGLLH